MDDEYDLPSSPSDLFPGATKFYIVVGCVAALLALALLQASCTLYRSSRRRTTKVRFVVSRNCLPLLRAYFLFHHFLSHPESTECVVSALLLTTLLSVAHTRCRKIAMLRSIARIDRWIIKVRDNKRQDISAKWLRRPKGETVTLY